MARDRLIKATRQEDDQHPAPRSRSVVIILGGALAAVVLVLYWRTARYEFVNLDDFVYVVENPVVRRGLSVDGLRWAVSTYHTGNWHPLTWVSLMLDVSVFGPGPVGPHVTNAMLHAASSALLFLTLHRMTAALWPSALTAALFAVHPLRAESVAWVSERKDVLAGLFWMLTLFAYQWYARQPALRRYLVVVAVFALGLTAKAMLVTLPVVLLLIDVWPLQRYRARWLVRDAATPAGARTFPALPLTRLIVEKISLLVLVAGTSALTVAAQRHGMALQDVTTLPISWRIANALDAYVVYIRKTVWPSDLAVFYPHPGLLHRDLTTIDLWRAAGAAVFLLMVTAGVLVVVRRRPVFAVGWLWYLGTLIPVIGLVQVGDQAFADRYTYIPTTGLYIATAWGLSMLAARPRARRTLIAGSAAAVAALSAVAWFQISTWHDSISLFTHALAVTEDNYFAHSNLGNLLRNEGRLEEAAAHFDRALAIKPDFAFAHIGYGTVLDRQGRLDEAAAHHERAVELEPTAARARANLGLVRHKQGRSDEAVAALEDAVRLDPASAFAQANLGMVLLSRQQAGAAIPHLQAAIRLQAAPATYNNLGVALVRQQRFAEAVVAFEQALRLEPDYANAQKGLEHARRQLNR